MPRAEREGSSPRPHDLVHAPSRERTAAGGTFPQDVTLRDKATEAMRKAQAGTPLHRFYESLIKRTKQHHSA
jgi:hypothetical protein